MHLGDLKIYKFDVPNWSDVGVIISGLHGGGCTSRMFRLTKYTGPRQRQGRAGLSKSFVKLVNGFFFWPESKIRDQIFDYIASNFCFKDLDVVPPKSPVLVFHFNVTMRGRAPVSEMDMTGFSRHVLHQLRVRDNVMTLEDAVLKERVLSDPPVTEILDCYQSPELCSLCGKEYPKEGEIVHKTKCNHIFHGSCISGYLSHTPRCHVCSTNLPPVDMRTLFFS